MSVAAQIDFKHARGVFRGVLTEAPPKTRGFESIPAESHPLWRGIKARLDRSKLRVLKEQADLNASRGNVLTSFLRFGQRECPADRYVLFFYGHGYGPLGLFFDAESDDASVKSTMPLTSLSDSLDAVGERAAVIVFRACLANTLETAYQLRDAAEFMLASQSIVPIAGIWPWGSFLTSLMPGAASGMWRRPSRGSWRSSWRRPANRDPFADVPSSLIDLGAAECDRGAIESARRRARDSARRRRTRIGVRGCARSGAGRVSRRSFRARRSGAPRRADDVRQPEELERDPVAGPARALGERRRASAREVAPFAEGPSPRYRALLQTGQAAKHAGRSHLYEEGTAAGDAELYKQLALSQATGWDRIALNPLRPMGQGARGQTRECAASRASCQLAVS